MSAISKIKTILGTLTLVAPFAAAAGAGVEVTSPATPTLTELCLLDAAKFFDKKAFHVTRAGHKEVFGIPMRMTYGSGENTLAMDGPELATLIVDRFNRSVDLFHVNPYAVTAANVKDHTVEFNENGRLQVYQSELWIKGGEHGNEVATRYVAKVKECRR